MSFSTGRPASAEEGPRRAVAVVPDLLGAAFHNYGDVFGRRGAPRSQGAREGMPGAFDRRATAARRFAWVADVVGEAVKHSTK